MREAPAISCPNCERLQHQVETLQQLVDHQQETLTSLSEQVHSLQEKLTAAAKNSGTSSKLPSSDLRKPPKPAPQPEQDKRQPGGQVGHPKHHRAAFVSEQINGGFCDHVLSCCPSCGHGVEPVPGPPQGVQRLDIRLIPVVIEEHRGHPVWCPQCLKMPYSPLPAVVEQGGSVIRAPAPRPQARRASRRERASGCWGDGVRCEGMVAPVSNQWFRVAITPLECCGSACHPARSVEGVQYDHE